MVIFKKLLSGLLKGLNRFKTYYKSINGFNYKNFNNFFKNKILSFSKSLSFSFSLNNKVILLNIVYPLKSITKYFKSIYIPFINVKDFF